MDGKVGLHFVTVLMSLCIHSVSDSVPVQMKTILFCARWKLRVTSLSLFRLFLSGTTFLLPSATAVFLSQFKTSLKTFLFTSAYLSYSGLMDIEC